MIFEARLYETNSMFVCCVETGAKRWIDYGVIDRA